MSAVVEATGRLTFETLLELRRPIEVSITADGSHIALTLAPVVKEKGSMPGAELWVGDVDRELERVGVPGVTSGLPRFSPDGNQLAFACDAEHQGRMSLHLLTRGELGSADGSVEDIRWSPDGRSLMVLAADLGSHRAGAQTATLIQQQDGAEDDPKVTTPAQFWRRLFLIDVATGKTRDVTPPGINVFEFGWAGGAVVAVCTEEPSESAWYTAWIGLLDVETGAVKKLHQPEWQVQAPRVSRGGRVAWIEGLSSDRSLVSGTVHVFGIGPLAPQLDVTWLDFADDGGLWYAGWKDSGTMFGRLSLDGDVREIWSGEKLIGVRQQPRIAPSASGARIAAVLESTNEPAEVVVFEAGRRRTLTTFNAHLAPYFAGLDWRQHRWTSPDGLEIHGVLGLPADRAKGTAVPLVVCAHGGPTYTWPTAIAAYPTMFLHEGYAVLLPNPRGSTGRGQEFQRANVGDLGGGDLQDILAGIDSLVDAGIVDDERVAITGGSYGGFMTTWAITQTDRFAAAAPFAVHVNWLSLYFTTNIASFCEIFLSANPFENSEAYWNASPVAHVQRCTTPTLLLHGEDDLCTPVSQATEFYNGLVEAGCETELVVYPREGHGWLEREHQIDAWVRTRDWFARYLGGTK